MAFLSPDEMMVLGREENQRIILSESVKAFDEGKTFDIFLSHSYMDKDTIKGVYKTLRETWGYSVYIDWIEDKELDRSKVNADTARQLQTRMRRCRSLLFTTTENSSNSKWMPWELGFMDGFRKGHVAILPVTDAPTFDGQEYLGMYPFVEQLNFKNGGKGLFVRQFREKDISFAEWLR